jgi:hypothetical protein
MQTNNQKERDKVLKNRKGGTKTNYTMKEDAEIMINVFLEEVLQLGELTFRKDKKTMKIQNPKDVGSKFKC